MKLKRIETQNAPSAIGPYSQAVAANGFVFISGQMPVDPATGEMCQGTIGELTECALHNAQAIAKEAGTDLSKAVKTTVFLTDINDFAEVNEAYAAFFTGITPARSCFAVASLPKQARVEIEVICML